MCLILPAPSMVTGNSRPAWESAVSVFILHPRWCISIDKWQLSEWMSLTWSLQKMSTEKLSRRTSSARITVYLFHRAFGLASFSAVKCFSYCSFWFFYYCMSDDTFIWSSSIFLNESNGMCGIFNLFSVSAMERGCSCDVSLAPGVCFFFFLSSC